MDKKRVPLIDRTEAEPRQVGWTDVDENGAVVGDLTITDAKFAQQLTNALGPLSVASDREPST